MLFCFISILNLRKHEKLNISYNHITKVEVLGPGKEPINFIKKRKLANIFF